MDQLTLQLPNYPMLSLNNAVLEGKLPRARDGQTKLRKVLEEFIIIQSWSSDLFSNELRLESIDVIKTYQICLGQKFEKFKSIRKARSICSIPIRQDQLTHPIQKNFAVIRGLTYSDRRSYSQFLQGYQEMKHWRSWHSEACRESASAMNLEDIWIQQHIYIELNGCLVETDQ